MVMQKVQESLLRLDYSHASSAHLLLGLLAIDKGIPQNILRTFGLSYEHIENYLSSMRSFSESDTSRDGTKLSASALLAIERAEIEAGKRQHTYLGIDHLLLGILTEENGEAADLFASLHVDEEQIRQIVSQELR